MRQNLCNTDLTEIVKNNSKYFSIITLSFLFFILGNSTLKAQFYTMPHNSMEELVIDSGFINDSGGSNNYYNNSNDTLVIIPETKGKFIRILFDTYNFEECCDKLYIYDGLNTSAPLIGFYTGFTEYPEKVSSTNEDGALPLVFISNESINYYGFDGWIFTEGTAYPDAGISNEILYSDTLIAGKNFYCRTFINNYSSEPFDSMFIQHYLSSDSIYDDEDTMLNRSFYFNIFPQSSQIQYFTSIIAGNYTEGNAFIITRLIDSEGQYDGLPENSIFANSVYIKTADLDLSISKIELSNNLVSPYKAIPVKINIENEGNEPDNTTKVGFYLSNDMELDKNDIKISKTETLFIRRTGDTPFNHTLIPTTPTETVDGIYYLLVNVDDDSILYETNENNNILVTQVIYKNNPTTSTDNIILKDVEFFTDTIVFNSKLQLSLSLHSNFSNNSIYANFLYLSEDTIFNAESDIYLDKFYTYPIPGEHHFEQKIKIDGPNYIYGQYYVFILLDYYNAYNESNEADNVTFLPLYIESIPITDLIVENAMVSPDSLVNYQYTELSCLLQNQGSVDIAQTNIKYYISSDDLYDHSDALISTENIYNINPGFHDIYTHCITGGGLTPGDYFILCIADVENLIEETDESNNMAVTPLKIIDPEVITGYDLKLLNLSCPDTIIEDSNCNFELEYFFLNSVSETVNFACFLSADSIFDISDFSNEIFDINESLRPINNTKLRNYLQIKEIESSGKYYLIFKADNYNRLTEDNELNNLIIKPVHLLKSVGIITDKIDFSNLIFDSKSEVHGSISYENIGTIPADSIVIKIFLSSLNNPENKIPLIADTIGNEIYGLTIPLKFSLPGSLQEDLYDLTILLQAISSEEVKNISGIEEHLTIGIMDYDVDLELKEFIMLEQSVIPNRYIDVYFSFINNGTTVFNETLLSYYLSEDDVLSADDYSLGSFLIRNAGIRTINNEEERIFLSDSIPSGHFHMFIVADPENSIIETSETNNTLVTEIEILSEELNLTIENMGLSKSSIAFNNSLEIVCTVRSSGNLPTNPSYVGFYLSEDSILDDSDKLFYSGYLNGMEPNTSKQIKTQTSFSTEYNAGRYFIICKADHKNMLTESNEEDNNKWIEFDLVIQEFDLEIECLSDDDTLIFVKDQFVPLMLRITNSGNSSLSKPIWMSLYLSTDSIFNPMEDIFLSRSLLYLNISSELFNQQMSIKLPVEIKNGEYNLCLWIDSQNDLPETNELNNFFLKPVNLMDPNVDLLINITDLPPDTISVNNYMYVDYNIKNQGKTSTQVAFYTKLYLSTDSTKSIDDQTVYSKVIPSLKGNSLYNVQSQIYFSENLDEGQYYILMEIDGTNSIIEIAKENNIAILPVYVKGSKMDLLVTNTFISPDIFSQLDMIHIFCRIENTSNEYLNKTSNIAYYLSDNNVLDETDELIMTDLFGYLSPNSYTDYSYYYTVSQLNPGNYFILFVVDYQNNIKEINEDNNIEAIPFEIIGSTIGINDSDGAKSETIIFPNPASHFLNIKAGYEIEEYKIFNSMGLIIMNNVIYNNSCVIDIGKLPPGMYFLELISDKVNEVLRFEVAY